MNMRHRNITGKIWQFLSKFSIGKNDLYRSKNHSQKLLIWISSKGRIYITGNNLLEPQKKITKCEKICINIYLIMELHLNYMKDYHNGMIR